MKNAMDYLKACLSEASFWTPERPGPESAWLEHAPFAFWLTDMIRPGRFVELGAHGGFSYFVFCQAAKRLCLGMKAVAVDTWMGDEHAGFYGEEIYESVKTHNDVHFSDVSTLLRMTFAEALPYVEDGSVDLLHIDGRHYYEDVKEDFETWIPKLSKRGVVLFHDIAVHDRGFGVHRLWDEISRDRPHFAFTHGSGLGVLGFGSDVPEKLLPFFEASAHYEAADLIRSAYGQLGLAVVAPHLARELANLRIEKEKLHLHIGGQETRIEAMGRRAALRNCLETAGKALRVIASVKGT